MKKSYRNHFAALTLLLNVNITNADSLVDPIESNEAGLTIRELVDTAVQMLDLRVVEFSHSDFDPDIERNDIQHSEAELDNLLQSLLELAAVNPVEALAIALRSTSEYELYRLLSPVLEIWTTQSPEQAYIWAQQQDQQVREFASSEVSFVWAQIDAPGFIAYADGLTLEARETLLDENAVHIAYILAENSPLDVLAWAETLSEQARTDARVAAFTTWYTHSPDQALINREQWLTQAEQFSFLASVAHDLPSQDFAFAQALFDQSDVRMRLYLAHGIVSELFSRDELEAQQWVNNRIHDAVRADAYSSLVYLIAEQQPEHAWSFLNQYQGNDRLSVLEQGLWAIAAYSPETVRRLLEQYNLAPDELVILNRIIRDLDDPERVYGC